MEQDTNHVGLIKLLEKMLAGLDPANRELIMHYAANNSMILVLIGLMGLDVITGLVAATIHRDIDSSYSFKGVLKKAQMLLMVAAGVLFEYIYPDIPWGKLIAGLMCLSEMISIVENAGRAGVPLPTQLKEVLKRLKTEKESQLGKVEINAPAAKEIKVLDSKVSLNENTAKENEPK